MEGKIWLYAGISEYLQVLRRNVEVTILKCGQSAGKTCTMNDGFVSVEKRLVREDKTCDLGRGMCGRKPIIASSPGLPGAEHICLGLSQESPTRHSLCKNPQRLYAKSSTYFAEAK